MSEETITIPLEEYQSLMNTLYFMNCLEGAGVDNWDGYEYAQDEYEAPYPDVD